MKHKITCDSFNHGMGLFEEIKRALKDCGSEVVKLKIKFCRENPQWRLGLQLHKVYDLR